MAIVTTDDQHYKDIAEKLRANFGNDEKHKPSEMAEQIDLCVLQARIEGDTTGYERGYNTGYLEGSALKDQKPYIDSSKIRYFYGFFHPTSGNPIELHKTMDYSGGVNFQNCFYGQITLTEVDLNAPNVTNLMQTFFNCRGLTKITLGNTSNCTNIAGICNGCTKLVEIIGDIDMTNVTVAGNAFTSCGELVTISFVKGSIGISVNFNQAPKLSLASAKSILLGLKNYVGTDKELSYTITLNSNTWALLDADGATSPNGNTWREYVVDKGWNA